MVRTWSRSASNQVWLCRLVRTETKTVTARDTLAVRLAPGGGLAVRIVPRR